MASDTVVAAAAVVIALAALFVSVWEGVAARRHNRLSVRPLMQLDFEQLHGVSASLVNNGFGPAMISSYAIEVPDDGNQTRALQDPHELLPCLQLSDLDRLGVEHVMIWSCAAGEVLGPQAKVVVLDFGDCPAPGTSERQRLVAKLEGLVFCVGYMSLYGEHFELRYRVRGGRAFPV